MALPNLEPESVELNSREKFARVKVRDLVHVKLVRMGARPPQWILARVLNTHKGGAQCRTEEGPRKDQFYNWSEIRPLPPETRDQHKPLATFGEMVRVATTAPALRSVPPFLDIEPPKPAESPPRREALLISRDDLKMANDRKPRQRLAHNITAIAQLFRAERVKRGWAQGELADALSINGLALSDQQVSKIELGRMPPTDDILIAFAEVCGLELDKVIAARDGDAPKPAESAVMPAAPVVVPPVAAVAAPPPPSAVVASPAPEFPDAAERLAQFTEELFSIAPPPLDREKRKEWFRYAARLFALSGS